MENDPELDALLVRSAPTPTATATATAIELAREISTTQGLGGWWRRRSFRIAVTACGALVLAGAGTTAAYELSIPPFQAVPPGVVRIQPGIPVEYTDSLGRRVECLAFMEFQNVDGEQQARLATIAESPVWAGWGDRTLQDLALTDAPAAEQLMALGRAVDDEMRRQAGAVVPEMLFMSDSSRPTFSGSAMSCPESGGIDGQP